MNFSSSALKTYLKKSSLQYNFASLLKHFSDKGFRQSQHTTHVVCHRRSDTFNKNLSKIGSLQPAQGSPTPIDGSARPAKKFQRRWLWVFDHCFEWDVVRKSHRASTERNIGTIDWSTPNACGQTLDGICSLLRKWKKKPKLKPLANIRNKNVRIQILIETTSFEQPLTH